MKILNVKQTTAAIATLKITGKRLRQGALAAAMTACTPG